MSATATRRQIRRAFGPQAAVQIESAIGDLQHRHSGLAQTASEDSARLWGAMEINRTEWTQDSRNLWAMVIEHEARLDRLASMTFWQRLRWLVGL